jgi:long-chain acyl-CoA synthetase
MKNLYQFFDETTRAYKNKILFDNFLTYGEAYNLAAKRAAYLKREGLTAGDVVGICAINSKEWCITYMAITMAGYIALPLDNNLPGENYSTMIDTLSVKLVFCSEDTIEKIDQKFARQISLETNIDDARYFTPADVEKHYPASYCYTSGTTGNAKIVVLTHENIFKTAVSDSTYLGLSPEDHFLCLLPLFHVYAFVANFTGPFAKGSSLFFLQSLKGPDIIAALKENNFTVFPAAPQLWELFMDSILNKTKAASSIKYSILLFFLNTTPFWKAIGLKFLPSLIFKPVKQMFGFSMKYFISGGAPLKKKYFQYYERMGLPIIEGYGLTETTGPICISHVKKNKMGSVGPAMPGNEIRIKNINSDGIGEIYLRGHSVMKEYYNNPEITSDVFDDDGFFNTGDLGRVDNDGYLFITGRLKNVIVLDSGKNVYPEELESYYKKSSLISSISVFGRKVNGKETVFAVIVPEEKSGESYKIILDEIKTMNKGLPGYKTINSFAISFDPLPVNSARKIIVREVLRKLERGEFMQSDSDTIEYSTKFEPANERESRVSAEIKKQLDVSELYAHESLSDHDIDSLETIELIVALEEELSVTIDVNKIRRLNTMQEIITYIATLEIGKHSSVDKNILTGPVITKPLTFYNPFIELCAAILRRLVFKNWHIEIENIENLKIENSIIVSNHQSNLDFLLMYAVLPYSKRKNLFVIGKKELSFLRFIFPGSNVLFLDRGGDVLSTMRAGADILRYGKSLYIFPEGTRSKDGVVHEFKTGAAYLSKNLNKKVIPITISGTRDILPVGKSMAKLKTNSKIKMIIGREVDPENYATVDHLNQHLFFTINSQLL